MFEVSEHLTALIYSVQNKSFQDLDKRVKLPSTVLCHERDTNSIAEI